MQSDNSMLEIMMGKLASQPAYMAWYLSRYSKEEKVSLEQVREKLQINPEQFGRLAMCKAPEGRATDFAARLKVIQGFTEANRFMLATIIRRVDALESLKSSDADTNLLAARKQDNLQGENGEDVL